MCCLIECFSLEIQSSLIDFTHVDDSCLYTRKKRLLHSIPPFMIQYCFWWQRCTSIVEHHFRNASFQGGIFSFHGVVLHVYASSKDQKSSIAKCTSNRSNCEKNDFHRFFVTQQLNKLTCCPHLEIKKVFISYVPHHFFQTVCR